MQKIFSSVSLDSFVVNRNFSAFFFEQIKGYSPKKSHIDSRIIHSVSSVVFIKCYIKTPMEVVLNAPNANEPLIRPYQQ